MKLSTFLFNSRGEGGPSYVPSGFLLPQLVHSQASAHTWLKDVFEKIKRSNRKRAAKWGPQSQRSLKQCLVVVFVLFIEFFLSDMLPALSMSNVFQSRGTVDSIRGCSNERSRIAQPAFHWCCSIPNAGRSLAICKVMFHEKLLPWQCLAGPKKFTAIVVRQ